MYGKKLKELRLIEGWTQQEVATKLGVSKQTYNHYENEKRKPGLEMIKKLAEVYQVNLDRVFGNISETPTKVNEKEAEYVTNEIEYLPIVGQIACGPTKVAYEDIEGYEVVPKDWIRGGEFFFLRANGDSMINARINHGDKLLIRRQNSVENGEIAAVMINDEATLKKVYKSDDTLILQAENSKYEPIFVKEGDIRIIGKLKKAILEF
ncbi:LexA family protein [Virgibacillus salexigens]|uniref:LexA family protein n=1 Tax=Virgibacillus salexigens TaxID=61016 RepID=UPI0030816003